MSDNQAIDSIGFDKAYISSEFELLKEHMGELNACSTTSFEVSRILSRMFTHRAIIQDFYPFAILPRKLTALHNETDLYLMGGYTPCGKAHLGSLLHITSMNLTRNVLSKTISFNDMDSKTSIRTVSKRVEDESIQSFKKICNQGFNFVKRTENESIMALYEKIQFDFGPETIYGILGRKITPDERKSLNIQAAAYLAYQLENPNAIVVGFDAIEEASRAVWINHVADYYGLPGFINFISFQVPSFIPGLKMGKSNEEGSVVVGDSGESVNTRLMSIRETREALVISYLIEALMRGGKPLQGVQVIETNDSLRIVITISESEGLCSDGELSLEDWIIIFSRIRSCYVLGTVLSVRDLIIIDKLQDSLFETNICDTSFGKLLVGAEILSRSGRTLSKENGLILYEISNSELESARLQIQKRNENNSDLYNFLTKDGISLKISKFITAATYTYNSRQVLPADYN
ncbi:MAG TPA: hypothetical protein PK609_01550 [Candidatus Paceibacterota bacterium]|nr:hypothetical protein [Candidatus Paceibacterota bacterium]